MTIDEIILFVSSRWIWVFKHCGYGVYIIYYILGDGKSAPNPLFKVKVILEQDKVEFSPTLKQLAMIVGSIAAHLTDSIAGVKRLPDILTRKKSSKEVKTQPLTPLIHQYGAEASLS